MRFACPDRTGSASSSPRLDGKVGAFASQLGVASGRLG